jgi:F-type H+-transporting ATPase subunit c
VPGAGAGAFAPRTVARGTLAPEAEELMTGLVQFFAIPFGLGMIVIGAGLGIGKLAAAAAEGIARQPSAAAQITGAVNLPLFLLEGVAILAEVFALLVLFLGK